MEKKNRFSYLKYGIGGKLILYIFLFSSLVTLAGTSLQLYLDYSRDVQGIRKQVQEINTSHLPSIVDKLWEFNEDSVRVQLEGILALPDIEAVEIKHNDESGISNLRVGSPRTKNTMEQTYPLIYHYKNNTIPLGTLHVVASLDRVYRRIFDRLLIILATQTVKTFLVSLFIILLFYSLVGRHLTLMADYTKSLDLDSLDTHLELQRSSQPRHQGDELEQLVFSINDMRLQLANDITKRKQAEATLLEREEDIRLLLHSTAEAIFGLDKNGNCTFCNPSCLRLLGYKREEDLIGKHMHGLIHHTRADGSSYPVDECKIYKCLKGEEGVHENREVLWRADGSCFWAEYWSYPVIKNEIIVGSVVTFIDISVRKQMEEKLREEKEFTETALNAQVDSFMVYEIQSGKPIRWNKVFNRITGYADTEIARMKAPDDWCKEADLARARGIIKNIIRNGYGIIEIPIITKDGRSLPTEYVASVIRNDEGRPTHIISLGRDISERKLAEEEKKKLEKQLSQFQKIEAIGTLAGGIAHDFNNILTPIIGYTELIKDEIPPGTHAQKYMDEVLKAANRAKELVKQILSFSRQTGQVREPLQVQQIIKEALKLLRASLPSTIEIRQTIDADCRMIIGDATQIHQVMMNLCTNAYHALRANGGILAVDLTSIKIDKEDELVTNLHLAPGNYLRLQISDNGHGMERSVQERIFEPYFTTKKKGEGTGMGLAMVHGIVKNHDGHISVDSEPGQGTSFHIYLPQVVSSLSSKTDHETEALPRGTERILLVDDEAIIIEMGMRILEKLGYQVTAMTNSEKALDEFRARPEQFDLIITDMTMPHLTGAELSQRIMATRDDIPIILCTGFSDLINKEKADALGIRKFLMKPVTRKEMAHSVRVVLDEKD